MGWTRTEKGLLLDRRQPKRGYYGMEDSRKEVTMGWTRAEKGLLWDGREPKRGYYWMDDSRKGVIMGWTTAEKGLLWDGRQPKSGYYGMDDSRKGVTVGWTRAEKGLLWDGREHPLSSPIRATFPAHLILLHFITHTILGEQYKSFSSSLCNLPHIIKHTG